MKLKSLALTLGTVITTYSGLVSAELETSANVALTTDYVWRGTSQADNGPAIQGGFDLTAGGFYGGVWGSNVDIDDDDLANGRAIFTVSKSF